MEQKYIEYCVKSYKEKFLNVPMTSSYKFVKNCMRGKHYDWNSENVYSELLADMSNYYGVKDIDVVKKILSVCSVYALVEHHSHQLKFRERMQYVTLLKRYE